MHVVAIYYWIYGEAVLFRGGSIIPVQSSPPPRQLCTGVKEHYCPQNNTAGRQYYTGTKLPGGGGAAGLYRYITASPEQNCPP